MAARKNRATAFWSAFNMESLMRHPFPKIMGTGIVWQVAMSKDNFSNDSREVNVQLLSGPQAIVALVTAAANTGTMIEEKECAGQPDPFYYFKLEETFKRRDGQEPYRRTLQIWTTANRMDFHECAENNGVEIYVT